ncbi:MAG: V-type ATP synthase subunit B, partial [Candidatus Bathyarchaeia archaeon]
MDRDRGGLGEGLKRQRLYVVETKGLREARGSILVTGGVPGAKFDEVVEVVLASGEAKLGRVIEVAKDFTVIQVFGGVSEVDLTGCKVRFKGETLKLPVSNDMLGRIFNGRGEPIDGGPRIVPEDYLDINGEPINPAAREPPSEFIETGISTIDGLNSLVRGQKLPIFSGSGLPHNRVVAQIIRQAAVRGEGEGFAVVFGAVGISYDDAAFFMKSLEGTGGLERTVAFINTASDPTIERIITPRLALTAAEFLAWREGLQALVILADMTNYCEALRELSAMREEVPGRRGYPGYMYTDLATMYERAGRISGRKGSVTIMPVLTMPDDD